jgi:hypothetical protein
MPLAMVQAYLERLPARQAEMRLILLPPILAPHIKDRERQRMVGDWQRMAGITKPSRPADAQLALMGIKVTHV